LLTPSFITVKIERMFYTSCLLAGLCIWLMFNPQACLVYVTCWKYCAEAGKLS